MTIYSWQRQVSWIFEDLRAARLTNRQADEMICELNALYNAEEIVSFLEQQPVYYYQGVSYG